MQFNVPAYSFVFYAGLILSIILAVIVWKRRPAPGAVPFTLFIISGAVWSFFLLLELSSVELSSKIVWADLQYLGILPSSVLWLVFALDYTGHVWQRRTRNLVLISLFPILTWGIVLTNPWHCWIWSNIYLAETHLGNIAVWEHGPWFWGLAVYQYALIISGMLVLVLYNRNKSRQNRKSVLPLILGASVPLVINLVYLFRFPALEGFDLTPVALALSHLIFAYTVFRYHLLDMHSLVRNLLVERIPEGILVLNADDEIIDINPAAEKISGLKKMKVKGQLLKMIWPDLDRVKPSVNPYQPQAILFEIAGKPVYLEISVTPVTNHHGILEGELIVLRDVTAQKTAEYDLRQSEEKLFRVFHSSPGAMVISTLEGRIIQVNQRLLDLSHYSEPELVGHNIDEFGKLHPSPVRDHIMQDFRNSKSVSDIQFDFRSRSGDIHNLLCSTTTVKFNNETLCLISASDITALNQAQESIQRKMDIENTIARISSRFVGTFDLEKDITASLSDLGNICRASRSYLFRIKRGGLLMDNTQEWCAPGVNPQIDNLHNLPCNTFPWWMSNLSKGETIHIPRVCDLPFVASAEKEILTRQGINSVLVFPVVIKNELAGFIGLDDVSGVTHWSQEDVAILRTGVDIISNALERCQAEQELKESEQNLRVSERKYRGLINNVSLGIFRSTPEPHGVFLEANPALETITGYSREELLAMEVSALYFHPNDRQMYLDQILRGETLNDIRLRKKDGSELIAFLRKSPVRDESGNILYFDGILADVTGQKKMQEKIEILYEEEKRQRQELEKEVQARVNFVNVLTHELKTPLTPLLLSLETLKDKVKSDPGILEAKLVNHAYSGADRLNKRLDELLDLAKLTTGTTRFNYRPVETGRFLSNLAARNRVMFENNHQILVADVEPALPVIQFDPDKLERALSYLLDSASKSSEPGDPVILRAKIDNRQLLIDIEDRGVGITPEERARLFEPYHRVEQDRQRFSGMGLGLAITKQIIDAHGGWIRVHSEPHKGNKFSLGIPI